MILVFWIKDEGGGILDSEYRKYDLFLVHDDSFEPALGDPEKRSKLHIHVPDPPAYDNHKAELVKPDWAEGPGEPVIMRRSRYYLPFDAHFTSEEMVILNDQSQQFPDGPFGSGGDMVSGVLHNRFTLADLIRKR